MNITAWPELLKSMAKLVHASGRPMALMWKMPQVTLKNDAFITHEILNPLPTLSGYWENAIKPFCEESKLSELFLEEGQHLAGVHGDKAKVLAKWDLTPVEDDDGIRGVLIQPNEASSRPDSAASEHGAVLVQPLIKLDEADFASTHVDRSAVAMVHDEFNETLWQQVTDWKLVHAMSKALLALTNMQDQMELVLATAASALDSNMGVISLYDAQKQLLITRISRGLSSQCLEEINSVALGDGACGAAFAQDTQIIIEDTETDPRYDCYRDFARRANIRAVISTPISDLSGASIGIISIYVSQAGRPNQTALQFIDICASHIAPLIERERITQELIKSQDWSRQILDTIGEGFVVMDKDFRITQINSEGLKIAGKESSELIGKVHWDAFPGSEDLDSGKSYKRVVREQVAIGLEQKYPIDGKDRWFDVHGYPTGDGLCVFFRDVTNKVDADQAVKQSRSRWNQLANTIPQLAWMADATGSIHWYNDRWYAYTGTTFEEMSGWGWEAVHDPELLPTVKERWSYCIETGEEFQMTFPLRAADGSFRPFLTLVSPLFDDQGKIVQWFGTNTDVSALQDAEQALKISEERLIEGLYAGNMTIWDWDRKTDQIVFSANAPSLFGDSWVTASELFRRIHPDDIAELHDAIEVASSKSEEFRKVVRLIRLDTGATVWVDFRGKAISSAAKSSHMRGICVDITERVRAEESLKLANRKKDEFLAMLAHELRNPLAPISTAAQLLRKPSIDLQRARSAGDVVLRQVEHMTSLVDDLLDVSRVTRGLATLNRDVVDLKTVIASAMEQAMPLLESRHHLCSVNLDSDPAFVLGDRNRLVQVVVNLLNNAAKYTPQGGKITLALSICDSQLKLNVTDNGIGIDSDLLACVFDLFAQGERTPDRSQGGLGLGLSLVKSLIELHGGSVEAKSGGTGQGSTFIITLDRIDPPVQIAAGVDKLHGTSADTNALKLLVVDDNKDAAQMLGEFLALFGHEVVVFHDALAALNSFEQHDYDCCILDIGLPDMNGYELAKRIREKTYKCGLLVALTGYGQEHDRVLSKAAGFDFHLVKPVDEKKLLSILQKQVMPAQSA